MQNTFGICVQRICFGSLNSLMLNTAKRLLPWQLNLKNSLTVDTQRNIKNLRFITAKINAKNFSV